MTERIDASCRRRTAFVLAAACGLLLVIVWPALRGRHYFANDLGAHQLPHRYVYAKGLAEGEVPVYTPGLFCGYYVHGEGGMGMYHPLFLILYRFLPFGAAFDVEQFSPYFLVLGGMYLLYRRWRLPPDAALLGAVFFAFSGFFLPRLIHIPVILVAAHLPWLLLLEDTVLRGATLPRRRLAWAGVVAATASQVLVGFSPCVFLSLQTELAYLAVCAFRFRPGWRAPSAWLLAKFLGLVCAAVQLVPTYETLTLSTRANSTVDFILQESLQPHDLVQLISPYYFAGYSPLTYEMQLYSGAAVSVLALWALVHVAASEGLRWVIGFGGVVAATGLLVALGRYGGLARLLAMLPVVGGFRVPARYLMHVHFGMATLAAVGAAALLRSRRLTVWSWAVLWLPAVLSLIVLAYAAGHDGNPPDLYYYGPWGGKVTGTALLVGATLLIGLIARYPCFAWACLACFTVSDLGFAGLRDPLLAGTRSWAEYCAKIPRPPGGEGDRIYNWETDDAPLVWGIPLVNGYAALKPARVLDYSDPVTLRVAGVRWVQAGLYRHHHQQRLSRWGSLDDPLPYARLVSHVVVSDDPMSALRACDPTTTAVVAAPLSLSPGPSGHISITRPGRRRLLVRTSCPAERLVVLAESHHPGWKLHIDGKPAATQVVNGDFLGCVAPAGDHTLVFEFSPWSLKVGGWVSMSGLLLTGLLLGASCLMHRACAPAAGFPS